MHTNTIQMGPLYMGKKKLTWLAEDYDVDEIMAVTICENFEDRLASYRLLAQQFELQEFQTINN